jgi:hypothetical protein
MGKLRRGLCRGFAEMGVSGCCCPRAALGKNKPKLTKALENNKAKGLTNVN